MSDNGEITRRIALAGGGAGVAAALLAACGGGGGPQAATSGTTRAVASNHTGAAAVFGSERIFRFTVVCHAISSAFFVPLQYGLQDACTLLGCRYDWVGSRTGDVQTMLDAIDRAVAAGVDGIATTLIEADVFNAPVQAALDAGIPVVAYNTDVADSPRMAFIGPDLHEGGREMGKRISQLLPGGGPIALFVATPGTANLRPRVVGVKQGLSARPDIDINTVATGTTQTAQTAAVQNYMQAHPDLAGYFAVDAGSTQAMAQTMQAEKLAANGIPAGGFDATEVTLKLLGAGQLNFVIDQQPYLQGFLAIVELYLYRVSQKLIGIADADTGLQVLTKENVGRYLNTVSRFLGTSSAAGVQRS